MIGRIGAVREFRLASKRAGTRKLAENPQLLGHGRTGKRFPGNLRSKLGTKGIHSHR